MTRIIIVGATGMVGSEALKLALESSQVSEVVVLTRRATGTKHAKLTEVIHQDFYNYQDIASSFRQIDAALFCLGAYTGSIPDAEFKRVTVDLTQAFAEILHQHSPQAVFCFLSGQGADPVEKSKVSFARYKGMAENALLAQGFRRVHIYRPGYIYPVKPREEPNLLYRLIRPLYPAISKLYSNIGLDSVALAESMLKGALQAGQGQILENRDILNSLAD